MIVRSEAGARFIRFRTMKQRTDIRCVICGREAVTVEAKLDGARVAFCGKHRRPAGDTLHEVLRPIRFKQAARKFLRKRV